MFNNGKTKTRFLRDTTDRKLVRQMADYFEVYETDLAGAISEFERVWLARSVFFGVPCLTVLGCFQYDGKLVNYLISNEGFLHTATVIEVFGVKPWTGRVENFGEERRQQFYVWLNTHVQRDFVPYQVI